MAPHQAVLFVAALSAAAAANAIVGPPLPDLPQFLPLRQQQLEQLAQLQQQWPQLRIGQLQGLQQLPMDQLKALQQLPQEQLQLLEMLRMDPMQQIPQPPQISIDNLLQLQQLQQHLPEIKIDQLPHLTHWGPLAFNPGTMREGLVNATSLLSAIVNLAGGTSLPFLASREEREETQETAAPSMDLSQLIPAVRGLAPFLSQETAQELAASLVSGNPIDLTEIKQMLQQAAAAAASATAGTGLGTVPLLSETEAQHIAEVLASLSPFVSEGISLQSLA